MAEVTGFDEDLIREMLLDDERDRSVTLSRDKRW
jgi:hypothetical protein